MNKSLTITKVLAFGFLKIVVRYREKKYAIVRYLRCDGDLREDNSAAPPYVTKTVSKTFQSRISKIELGKRIEGLRQKFKNEGKLLELDGRMTALCHQLGFYNFSTSKAPNNVSDYFVSPSSGIVGIPIIYELNIEAGFPLHTLADIFGRRGFIFVPTDSIKANSVPLPIYTNVHKMLLDWQDAEPIAKLDDKHFSVQSSGLVCSLDVNGYGQLLRTSQGSVLSDKNQIQDGVRNEVVRLTSKLLWHLRCPPHQILGDGALFCLPADSVNLKELCRAYREIICNSLMEWNKQIRDGRASGSVAGSRLTVIKAGFYFGRTAGAESLMPGIAGQSLIDVVRLDSGFKDHIKSNSTQYDGNHFFISLKSLSHAGLFGRIPSRIFTYSTKEGQKLIGRYTALTKVA